MLHRCCAYITGVDAKTLIALEGTFAQLGELYETARQFTALAQRADDELLPGIEAVGRHLRALLRNQALSSAEVEETARRIVELRSTWEPAVQGTRDRPEYRAARAAFERGDVAALRRTIPAVFAHLHPAQPGLRLYFPIPVSTGRRRQGRSPFLSADECADRIAGRIATGVTAEPGTQWWEQDFPAVVAADDPAALETPLSLVWLSNTEYAVFATPGDPFLRIYGRAAIRPFAASVLSDSSDEWWDTHEQTYADFRAQLLERLRQADVPVAPT